MNRFLMLAFVLVLSSCSDVRCSTELLGLRDPLPIEDGCAWELALAPNALDVCTPIEGGRDGATDASCLVTIERACGDLPLVGGGIARDVYIGGQLEPDSEGVLWVSAAIDGAPVDCDALLSVRAER